MQPIATVMRRLLTGYAVSHNRRHRRSGHLFQNRYKSILCQEDVYLIELVRYIHLNPLRAKIIESLAKLDKYQYCGHSRLMGTIADHWQATVGDLLDLPPGDIIQPGKQPKRVQARSLVCHWAVNELALNGTTVGHRLGLTQSAVSRAVQRGRKLSAEMGYELLHK